MDREPSFKLENGEYTIGYDEKQGIYYVWSWDFVNHCVTKWFQARTCFEVLQYMHDVMGVTI